MSRRDALGIALGALWVAGHIAALTLLGVTISENAGPPSAIAARPDPAALRRGGDLMDVSCKIALRRRGAAPHAEISKALARGDGGVWGTGDAGTTTGCHLAVPAGEQL